MSLKICLHLQPYDGRAYNNREIINAWNTVLRRIQSDVTELNRYGLVFDELAKG